MARSAVLAGRTSADLVRNVFTVAIITAVGFAVGFRIGTNFGLFLCGILIVLLFSYTLCWGFATAGLSAPNAETAQLMVFPILFPLIFASSAFVPVSDMPGLAAGLREAPAGHPGGRRRALAHDGRQPEGHRCGLGRAGVVHRAPRGAHPAGGAQVPPRRLTPSGADQVARSRRSIDPAEDVFSAAR